MARKKTIDISQYKPSYTPPPRKLYWHLGSKRYHRLFPIPYSHKLNIEELKKVLLIKK